MVSSESKWAAETKTGVMSVGAILCDGLYSRPQLYSLRQDGSFHLDSSSSGFEGRLYTVAF